LTEGGENFGNMNGNKKKRNYADYYFLAPIDKAKKQ
jgi:hypothetical protein